MRFAGSRSLVTVDGPSFPGQGRCAMSERQLVDHGAAGGMLRRPARRRGAVTKRLGLLTVGACVLIGPGRAASAQDVADVPPRVEKVRAVERGWFMQADVGMTVFVNELDNRRYGPGPQVGVFVGYDLLPILNLGVGVAFWGGEVSEDDDIPPPVGDLFYLIPTVRAQFAVVTTERNYMWLRGDVGFGFGMPSDIDGVDYAGNGPVFGVTAGFERFTKLRHFAIGIHAGVLVVTEPDIGIGITVTPTLKYTF